ncbi:MAG: hypothetical protein R6U98_05465 [Pirellulaceae bacterium]
MTSSRANVPAAIDRWLAIAVEREASDVHLVVGRPPVLRVHGQLQPLDEPNLSKKQLEQVRPATCPPPCLQPVTKPGFRFQKPLDHTRAARFCYGLLDRFRDEKNAGFSLELPIADHLRRFRVNCFFAGRNMGACFRVIPSTIPDFTWANFPLELADKLVGFRNGLMLVSGVTGSGKTTSLAMLVNRFNLAGGYFLSMPATQQSATQIRKTDSRSFLCDSFVHAVCHAFWWQLGCSLVLAPVSGTRSRGSGRTSYRSWRMTWDGGRSGIMGNSS